MSAGSEHVAVIPHSLSTNKLPLLIPSPPHIASSEVLPHLPAPSPSSFHPQGGVGISLQLGALRLLLISSHLAAHDEQVKRRNADFHRIRAGLFNNSSGSTPPPPDQQRLSALSRAASVAGPLLASAGETGGGSVADNAAWC